MVHLERSQLTFPFSSLWRDATSQQSDGGYQGIRHIKLVDGVYVSEELAAFKSHVDSKGRVASEYMCEELAEHIKLRDAKMVEESIW